MPALYAPLSVMTALREANQVGDLQSTTLARYDADIKKVFDARDQVAPSAFDMDASSLADPTWRDQMKSKDKALTQQFAEKLVSENFHGLLVRSFTSGAREDDLNLVLWSWGGTAPSRLSPIDDEGRLGRRA